jgi:hypothetical protein
MATAWWMATAAKNPLVALREMEKKKQSGGGEEGVGELGLVPFRVLLIREKCAAWESSHRSGARRGTAPIASVQRKKKMPGRVRCTYLGWTGVGLLRWRKRSIWAWWKHEGSVAAGCC